MMNRLKFWFFYVVVLFTALVCTHKADATTLQWVSDSDPSLALAATITTADPLTPGVNVVDHLNWTLLFGIPSATYEIPGGYAGNRWKPSLNVTISTTGSVESMVTIDTMLYCGWGDICYPGSPYGSTTAFLQLNSIGVWDIAPIEAPFNWWYCSIVGPGQCPPNADPTITLPVVTDTGHWVVTDYPTPEEQAQAIQDFIDSSIEQGNLVGNGPNDNASKGKLRAFQNMLISAYDLIASGDIQGACVQLSDAYEKTDGQSNPPDFVDGDAAVQVAAMIQNLMASLGCQ